MQLAITVTYSAKNKNGVGYLHAKTCKGVPGGRCSTRYQHTMSGEDNFMVAAKILAEKLGWLPGVMVPGWIAGDRVAVFVFVPARSSLGALIDLAKGANPEGGALHKSVTVSELAAIHKELCGQGPVP